MNAEFLNWIMENKFTPIMKTDEKNKFLEILRDKPEQIANYASRNMHNWCVEAAFVLRSVLFNDIQGDGDKVLQHLLKIYKDEIAKLPQA